jgi:hypothetical protein
MLPLRQLFGPSVEFVQELARSGFILASPLRFHPRTDQIFGSIDRAGLSPGDGGNAHH